MSSRLRLLIALVIVALPFSMAAVQLAVRHQAALTDLSPAPYPNGRTSDSLFYWHQAGTFAAAGLNGGYYTASERPAALSFSHYYAWGIFVPAFYGTFAAVFGAVPALIPLVNLTLLTLALAAYVLLVRPDGRQMLLVGGFVVTSSVFHILYASSMTGLLNLSIAVVTALWTVRLNAAERVPSVLTTAALVLTLSLATLLVPTWGLLLPLLLSLGYRHRPGAALARFVAGGLAFALLALYSLSTAAPFPNPMVNILGGFAQSPGEGWTQLTGNIARNIVFAFQGTLIERGTRLLLLIAAFGCGITWFRLRRRGATADLAIIAVALAGIYGLIMLVYDQGGDRDFRLFAPYLLFAALVLVGTRRLRAALALLAAMTVLLPFALYDGGAWAESHISRDGSAFYERTRAALNDLMPYRGDAASPWCNTLMMSFEYVNQQPGVPMAVPFGVGLSWGIEEMEPDAVRSQYLLLDEAQAARFTDLTRLLDVPGGAFYRNERRACAAEGER